VDGGVLILPTELPVIINNKKYGTINNNLISRWVDDERGMNNKESGIDNKE
jgi:hypothetical protein